MSNPENFLTAEWHYLAMLNYEVDPDILMPFVPPGTELDDWYGKTYVSLVGFLFWNTRVWGIPVPFHADFEEINLRFYVKRLVGEKWRRGVVFIKEIVGRPLVAFVARRIYNENYTTLPTRHSIEEIIVEGARQLSVQYAWQFKNRWNHIDLKTQGMLMDVVPDSIEEFITDHYWGYVNTKKGYTLEYQVEHPPWQVWQSKEFSMDYDIVGSYGEEFAESLNVVSSSAFLVRGSPVAVRRAVRLKEE